MIAIILVFYPLSLGTNAVIDPFTDGWPLVLRVLLPLLSTMHFINIIQQNVAQWEQLATDLGIPRNEMELMKNAFKY